MKVVKKPRGAIWSWAVVFFIGLEFWLLVVAGGVIGAFNTVLAVFLTGFLGLSLMKGKGLRWLINAQQQAVAGQAVLVEMLGGIAMVLGGILLLLPGFITDFIGLLCLISPVRRFVLAKLLARFFIKPDSSRAEHEVIEGKFHREE